MRLFSLSLHRIVGCYWHIGVQKQEIIYATWRNSRFRICHKLQTHEEERTNITEKIAVKNSISFVNGTHVREIKENDGIISCPLAKFFPFSHRNRVLMLFNISFSSLGRLKNNGIFTVRHNFSSFKSHELRFYFTFLKFTVP